MDIDYCVPIAPSGKRRTTVPNPQQLATVGLICPRPMMSDSESEAWMEDTTGR